MSLADVFPPLRRDYRVHGWIMSSAISQAGDMAWYIGLAWSAAQITTPAGARRQGSVAGSPTRLRLPADRGLTAVGRQNKAVAKQGGSAKAKGGKL
jgi:hypothetical protein